MGVRAAVAVVLAVALAPIGRAEEDLPLVWARYRLEGPLARAELVGTRGRTVLELGLQAGERREVELPLAHVRAAGEPPLVHQAPEPGSGVQFLGWVERPTPTLPAALRARPRPPWRPSSPRLPIELALVLVALGPVTLALRRRPRVLLIVGAVAATLAVLVQAQAAPPRPGLQRALEGTRDGQRWLAVDVAPELALDPAEPLVLAVEPAGARVVLLAELREGTLALTAKSPNGALVRRAELDPGLRLLAPGLNTWGPLAEVWIRPARDSDWRAHGPWGLGRALGSGEAGRPPGWLAAGAAQGRGILVARLGPEAWGGARASGSDRAAGETWLRLVGFE